jgi:hypothetical protein
MHAPHLRRVFLEIASARGVADMDSATVRDAYWENPAGLMEAWERARFDYQTTPPKYRGKKAWEDISRSATLFSRNELNIGRSIPPPAGPADAPAKFGPLMLGPDGDGYLPATLPISDAERLKLEKSIVAMRDGTVKPRPKDPVNERDYARLQALLARRGIDLILVMTPLTTRDYHATQNAPPGSKLLAFDDPARYPELYVPAHRFDSDHLNDFGARIFSKALAQAYLSEK